MKVKLVSIACIPKELNKIRWLNQNNEERFVNLAMISYIVAEVVMKLVFENYREAFT